MGWFGIGLAVLGLCVIASSLLCSYKKPNHIYGRQYEQQDSANRIAHHSNQQRTNDAENQKQPTKKIDFGIKGWFISNEKWLNALSTLFIAIFTILLAFSTIALYCATRNLVEGANDTAAKQLRAYVGIDETFFELTDKAYVTTVVKNYGATPASDVSTYANVIAVQNINGSTYTKLPPDFDFPDQLPNGPEAEHSRVVSHFMLQPQQHYRSRVPLSKPEPVREIDKGARDETLYIYGHVDYTDIYSRRWRNVFCFMYERNFPVGERFLPYETHNEEIQVNQ